MIRPFSEGWPERRVAFVADISLLRGPGLVCLSLPFGILRRLVHLMRDFLSEAFPSGDRPLAGCI